MYSYICTEKMMVTKMTLIALYPRFRNLTFLIDDQKWTVRAKLVVLAIMSGVKVTSTHSSKYHKMMTAEIQILKMKSTHIVQKEWLQDILIHWIGGSKMSFYSHTLPISQYLPYQQLQYGMKDFFQQSN